MTVLKVRLTSLGRHQISNAELGHYRHNTANFPCIWKLASETNESKTVMREVHAALEPTAHEYFTIRLLRAAGYAEPCRRMHPSPARFVLEILRDRDGLCAAAVRIPCKAPRRQWSRRRPLQALPALCKA